MTYTSCHILLITMWKGWLFFQSYMKGRYLLFDVLYAHLITSTMVFIIHFVVTDIYFEMHFNVFYVFLNVIYCTRWWVVFPVVIMTLIAQIQFQLQRLRPLQKNPVCCYSDSLLWVLYVLFWTLSFIFCHKVVNLYSICKYINPFDVFPL